MPPRPVNPAAALSRRSALGTLGAVSVAATVGCGSDVGPDASGGAGTGGSGGEGGAGPAGPTAGGGHPGQGGATATSSTTTGATTTATTSSTTSGPGTCTLYPQQTEGPFYLDEMDVRTDITEGKEGLRFVLDLVVLAADGCTPIEGAVAEIWHADADGVYSGFPNQLGGLDTTGQTFLRGQQPTDANGLASFVTIYPGWYNGRTPHIHFKVHLGGGMVVTSQLYFEDDVSAQIYETGVYADRGTQDTTNARDGIYNDAIPALAAITEEADGVRGTLTITVAAS